MSNFNNLKQFRTDHDLKQSDIANLLQTTQQQYSRYEKGTFPMPIEQYKKLALIYNISVDYLCGLCILPRTLTGEPYQVSKHYVVEKGKVKRAGN